MSRLRAASASVLGAVALGATLSAWLQSPPDVTAAEAASVAQEALADIGVEDAVINRDVEPATYTAGEGGPVAVWKVEATVEGGWIWLWLARSDAEPIFLDDRTPDRSAHLLDDEQYQQLARLDADPAFGRHLRRNLLATGAGAAIMLLAVALGTTTDRAADR